MTRRFFWQVSTLVKFRIIFEDAETILGATADNQHFLFRKDTGVICFSQREAFEKCLALLVENEPEEELETLCA